MVIFFLGGGVRTLFVTYPSKVFKLEYKEKNLCIISSTEFKTFKPILTEVYDKEYYFVNYKTFEQTKVLSNVKMESYTDPADGKILPLIVFENKVIYTLETRYIMIEIHISLKK